MIESPLGFTQLDHKMQQTLKQLSKQTKRVFVTGAGGFLGKAICHHLRAANINVTGFARGNYPQLSALGVTLVRGDLNNYQAVLDAMKGCDLVFHVASKAGVWGSKDAYFSTNIEGTDNIIKACLQLGLSRLVYTSTPSVTFAGNDENYIDESHPYADKFLNFYGLSKAIAEQHILEANQQLGITKKALNTVALRPHLIWGPGDPHLVPRVLDRAQKNKLKLVGKKDKLVDTIYIDNAVYAHLLAAQQLSKPTPTCAGKAYFLSNDEPILMADMLNRILACQELPPVTQRIPANIAYGIGYLLELIYTLAKKKQEPIMTRFVARQLSTSHYFNISAAKQDLDYQPLISTEQGMEKLKAWLT